MWRVDRVQGSLAESNMVLKVGGGSGLVGLGCMRDSKECRPLGCFETFAVAGLQIGWVPG